VPVLLVDLTQEEADLLLATLDPLAGLAESDPDRVMALHSSVESSSEAVRVLLADIARGVRRPPPGGLTDPDDIPSIPVEPRTCPGDLYVLGPHRMLCGDATEPEAIRRVTAGEDVRAMWTDPPYGVDYTGKTKDALTIRNDGADGLGELLRCAFSGVDEVLLPGAALYVAHPAGPLAVTFATAFVAQGWRVRQTLVWVKDSMVLGHGDYHYRHEPLLYGHVPGPGRWGRGHRGWYGGNAETSVFEVARPRASREHPTSKPVELVRRCLQNSTRPGDLVLDPFLGSGTTLLAAHQLGRRCVGIEIDPRYVDVAIERWEAFTGERAERIDERDR
jgi:DNA modification methylase